jgi:tetratricopeptide (TPR) repeat protein
MFVRLSVFVGGSSLEAVEKVLSDAGTRSSLGVLDGLASLVDKNLLRRDVVAGKTRFWMLETIREYSRIRFKESSDAKAVMQRYASYFLQLAEDAEPELRGHDQTVWLDRLERENSNLQAAMEWFVASGKAHEGLRLTAALEWFWYSRGHFTEGKRWLQEALDSDGAATPSVARARALDALGWMVFLQGDWPRARALFGEGIELSRRLYNRKDEAIALSRLGVAERWLGEYAAGTDHSEEAVRIAREMGDPLRLAETLIRAYGTTGGKFAHHAPRAELEEALGLSRQSGDLWGKSHALNGLGDLFRELGDYRGARLRYEEALEGFRQLKNKWMIAWTLEGLGRVSYLDGDHGSAKSCIQESIALFDLLGDKSNAVFMLSRLGMVERSLDCQPRAARLLGAFKSIQEDLVGHEAASRMQYSEELKAAFAEHQADFAPDWARGQAMTFRRAVGYALEDSHSAEKK